MLRTAIFHIILLMAPAVLFMMYLVIARKVRLSKSGRGYSVSALP